MGWLPDQGFLQARWDIYAELMTMYLMAIGSPTHAIPRCNLGCAAATVDQLWWH